MEWCFTVCHGPWSSALQTWLRYISWKGFIASWSLKNIYVYYHNRYEAVFGRCIFVIVGLVCFGVGELSCWFFFYFLSYACVDFNLRCQSWSFMWKNRNDYSKKKIYTNILSLCFKWKYFILGLSAVIKIFVVYMCTLSTNIWVCHLPVERAKDKRQTESK